MFLKRGKTIQKDILIKIPDEDDEELHTNEKVRKKQLEMREILKRLRELKKKKPWTTQLSAQYLELLQEYNKLREEIEKLKIQFP